MGLPRGRRAQTLIRTGRVLLLTISIGFAVLVIMAAPIMTPLTSPTQAPPMVAKGSNRNNDEGTKRWTQTYGGPEWDGGRSVEQTADGGYIIAGVTVSYGAGEGDVWVIKTDATGNAVSKFPWGTVFLALAVIGIVLVWGVVFAKRKR